MCDAAMQMPDRSPIEIATMNKNRRAGQRERERERLLLPFFTSLQHHFLLFIWDLVCCCRCVAAAAAVTYKVNKCV